MKKIDLGQTISILANIGVIAGIIFLAIEIGQNNELMQAAARDARNERITDYVEQVYTVPGLAEIIQKVRNGEPLTAVEDLRLFNRKVRLIRGFEAQYREFVIGNGVFSISNWQTYFYDGGFRNPPMIDVWEEVKPLLSAEFVQFIDVNVLTR